MKVNRVGRPPKVKWVPTISKGSQQLVRAPQVRAPLVRAPLVRAQTPQVRAPRPQVQAPQVQAPRPQVQAPQPQVQAPQPQVQAPLQMVQAPLEQPPQVRCKNSDTSIALCILFSVCVLPCLRAHEFAAEQGQPAHCIMDCATFRLLQGGAARGLYFSSCHPVHQHPV